ncbi:helix-turn-helix domain-containing protein [Brachybacterium halotolerans subsp. kimchii]|uniref:SRPBCC domain-containing protein n=1 Tax=Brachybacterium halotolerans TaxID=2795215 RepID=UPI001E2DEF3D|nr:SRPBCC domain-containing protein [Brachybacterium halotolerans]UEJ81202.1 helix-turn-helix domain-containing protein [Brachybacterium halotolerans subsp. kimchii]
MADPDARARHTSVWDALAHPARRRIVEILRGAPAPTGRIHETLEDEGLSTSRFATLRHLEQMREADLVLATRSGRERINALNGSALYEATIGWLAPPDRSLATSLHRLRLSAEESAMSEVRHLSVHQSILISAPRERIWSLLTRDTRSWWRPPFALLGDADEVELVIPERAGGSVIERSGPGPERTAAWGMLVRREEGTLLEWTSVVCGAPGASGTVRITLEPAEEAAARLTVTQDAVGVLPDGIDADIELGWSNKLTTISGLLAGADGHDAS